MKSPDCAGKAASKYTPELPAQSNCPWRKHRWIWIACYQVRAAVWDFRPIWNRVLTDIETAGEFLPVAAEDYVLSTYGDIRNPTAMGNCQGQVAGNGVRAHRHSKYDLNTNPYRDQEPSRHPALKRYFGTG